MFGIHDFTVFLAAGIILNVIPGQDTLYILSRSVSLGRGAGVASVLGISSGGFVHTLAAALGLSGLLTATPSAFLAVKLLGAAYLVYLGARMLLTRPSAVHIPSGFTSSRFFAVYRQGLLTNLLNPKVGLFFLAFMPQFISADSPSHFLAFLALGLCFITTGTIWCLCVAWFASQIGERLRGSTTLKAAVDRTAGILLIAMGVRLAVAK